MGHALYSSASDYMRFVRMFLNRGQLDGVRILSEAALDRMLANSIGDVRVGKMTTVAPPISADVDLFPGIEKTHSLGFLRVEEDVPGMRSAGSQGWAGVCNTHFWFDPSKDVAGLIMTQTLPFVEPRFLKVYEAFERAVYSS
jgi:CubicO group peptidase (beta-lactamase class C family)